MRSPVYKVAVRLPSFWPEQPALWFVQAEDQFHLAAITCPTLWLNSSLRMFTDHRDQTKRPFQVTALP